MEYVELRSCIFERLEALDLVISAKESRYLHRALDHALRDTARRYVTTHERMLRAWDRLAGRSRARRGLDEALSDILHALQETVGASVDSVSVLLVGDDGRLHVRATVGLEEELASGFSLSIDEGFAGRVARTRRPLLLHDAAHDAVVVSPAIRRRGTRALYGVPLVDEGRLVGVAHMGSRDAFDFAEEDLMLFRAMCDRATTSILRAELVESLERTARFREEFLGILGHDLRSPLNSVLGTASLLAEDDELPAKLRPRVERIERASHRMARLVTQVLDFTRARLGAGFALRATELSLLDLAREVADEQTPLLSRRRLEVEGEPVRGVWDHDRLAQVLANLVGNAVKYSPDASGIRVTVRRDDAAAVIEVWNEGPPIAPGTKLFEPFERGNQSGEGLGLGLYIAHEIVRAHGGSLSVRSDETGTTFRVCLPFARAPKAADADAAPQSGASASS